MIKKISDEFISASANKFLFSNAVAGRAKQLSEGSLPYIETENSLRPVLLALEEFRADKVRIKLLTGPRPKVERFQFDEASFGPSLEREKAKKKKME